MPKRSLFIGHGCPLNALPTHGPGRAWQSVLKEIGRTFLADCKAMMVVSAHWQTRGTEVFASTPPHTIHDFVGFPDELYKIQYTAPGALDHAQALVERLREHDFNISCTDDWGYDHGVWSPLLHLDPTQSIPVFMVSLDRFKSLDEHLALGTAISKCLDDDVVVIGSGNIVHSLARATVDNDAPPADWAVAFDDNVSEQLMSGDLTGLTQISRETESQDYKCVPSLDHFAPLLYAATAVGADFSVTFPFTGFQNSTISMRCAAFTSASTAGFGHQESLRTGAGDFSDKTEKDQRLQESEAETRPPKKRR